MPDNPARAPSPRPTCRPRRSRSRSTTSRWTRSSPTRQGRFVRNLTKDDFQVFEDGKPQTISTFALVDIPVERPDRPLYTETPIEPDVETNERPFDGRVYVMILDDLHVDALRSQLVKSAARRFIEQNLGANDLMAVIFTGGRADAAQEFTSNKRLLLASVDRFIGRKLQSATLARNDEYFRQAAGAFQDTRIPDPYEQERAYNAQGTMRSLRQVAEWFAGVRGRRKTMLFISEGIDYDVTDLIRQPDTPMSSASVILDDIREAIQATARANVSIYAIDPRGLTSIADETIGVTGFAVADNPAMRGIGPGGLMNELQLSQDNLRALSEETNGFAVVNRNDPGPAFERIVDDNSSYYVLAYYPPSDKKDGKFHRIQVRVNRPGLTVRARRGYLAPKGNSKPAAPPKTTGGASPASVEALNSPIQVSGLTMRAFAAPFKGAAPNASVLVGVEVRGRDLSYEANNKLELSFLAVDASGKQRAGKTDTRDAQPAPGNTRAGRADGPAIPEPHGPSAGTIPASPGLARHHGRGIRVGHLRPRDPGLLQGAVHHERPRAHVDVGGRGHDRQARRTAEGPPARARDCHQELSAER